MIEEFQTLNDVVRYWSKARPDEIAYNYYGIGDSLVDKISFQDLYKNSCCIANYLLSNHEYEQTALLLFQSPFEFIKSFFGCNLAGKISIPMFPPRCNQKIERLENVIRNSGSKLILTSERVEKYIKNRIEDSDISIINISNIVNTKYFSDPSLEILSSSNSFIQYTSGSTGTPKGVVIKHNNILNNQIAIQKSFGHGSHTKFTSWLPFFHDMGLVGGILQPFYLGVVCNLMLPEGFQQKPYRWLKLISDTKSTTTGAPNFAFHLCVNKIYVHLLRNLDLSCLDVLFNGAEKINAETMKIFTQYFSRTGFRANSFYPCYGMAESTLLLTGGDNKLPPKIIKVDGNTLGIGEIVKLDKGGKELVSCGNTWAGNEIKIVDPFSFNEYSDFIVGEIWTKGPSIFSDYWQIKDPRQNYLRSIVNRNDKSKFYRTGDLGFISNGHLYITGRLKELIIINGRNLYSKDIEWFIEKIDESLMENSTVVFEYSRSYKKGIIVISEIKRCYMKKVDQRLLKRKIMGSVSEEYGIKIYDILLVRPLNVPKTSSNKIQRSDAKRKYICNEYMQIPEYTSIKS